jgi:hypothetical protein
MEPAPAVPPGETLPVKEGAGKGRRRRLELRTSNLAAWERGGEQRTQPSSVDSSIVLTSSVGLQLDWASLTPRSSDIPHFSFDSVHLSTPQQLSRGS